MKNRRLDANWDYCFGRGAADYLVDLEACSQAIKSRLLLLYGEWWEDTKGGLPLFEKILGARPNPKHLQAVDIIFRDRIASTKGVLSVSYYKSEVINKQYSFIAQVETEFGSLIISNSKEESV